MTYTPDWTDPRVQARLRRAYGFARGCMSETQPRRWSQKAINKNFGHQTDNLGRYLRSMLLVCTDNHYSMDTGKPKEYRLNPAGMGFIKHQIQEPDRSRTWTPHILTPYEPHDTADIQLVVEHNSTEYAQELATANFQYTDKSDRLWHPLQNIRSPYRDVLFNSHGYHYKYDITTAAPRLLYEISRRAGYDIYPRAILQYLNNRDAVRQQTASDCNTTVAVIKRVINAVFCGARLQPNIHSSLFVGLRFDRQLINSLKSHAYIQELLSDIRNMWRFLGDINTGMITRKRSDTGRLLPITAKDKWILYFRTERQVLNSVRDFLISKDQKHFLIHDGWMCDKELDTNELEKYVKHQTGLSVIFSGEQIIHEA